MNKLEKLQVKKVLTLDEYNQLRKWSGPCHVEVDGNKVTIHNKKTKLVTEHHVLDLDKLNEDHSSLESSISEPKWEKHVEVRKPKNVIVEGNTVKVNMLNTVQTDFTVKINTPTDNELTGTLTDGQLSFDTTESGTHKITVIDEYGTSSFNVFVELSSPQVSPEESEEENEDEEPGGED